MKEKFKFGKGIKTVHIPIMAKIEGESIRQMRRVIGKYEMPKSYIVKFVHTITIGKKLNYELTEIIIEK